MPRAASEVRLDGALDEPVWAGALALELGVEFDPGNNTPAPVRTECFVVHDDHALYVAFRAHDPSPGAVRAHLSDRDQMDGDDTVGLLLDTFNDRRRAFGFFVNPLGVQMDLSRNDVGGNLETPEDLTWDAIWRSAARRTEGGYEVEIAIPFTALRFPRVEGEQTWGFLPTRSYPRSRRHQMGLVPIDRNRSCTVCQSAGLTGFDGITPGRNLDLYPTLTATRTDERADVAGAPLEEGGIATPLGLTVRWGMTPNLGLGATLNPDFSQVEADVAQLDINTRFALFYPEKRPFFMEGADFFSTPLNVVYTRTVNDPDWGLKMTGKEGRHALGVAVARDTETFLLFPSNQSSDETDPPLDAPSTVGVLRYRFDVGQASTVGVMATSREGGDYHNRLAGADAYLRFGKAETLRAQVLRSDTRYPDTIAADFGQPAGSFDDSALTLRYSHESRDWFWLGVYEDLGRDFRADAGFIPRVDTRRKEGILERIVWSDPGSWLTRVFFGTIAYRVEDHDGLLTDRDVGLHGGFFGPRQSLLFARGASRREHFEGVTYDQTIGEMSFEMRPTGNLRAEIVAAFGDAIDYDNAEREDPMVADPAPAHRLFLSPELDVRFGRRLSLGLDHAYEKLEVDGGRLYTANLTQMRLVYQFSLRTFARAIVQYEHVSRTPSLFDQPVDAVSRDLLTQFLFSYKVNPQTLVYVGSTSGRTNETYGDLTLNERTFFFKIGYAWIP